MFRTKSEVDKHAGRLLMRIQNPSDRNKESLKIARLYFDINEFREASFYLSNYLSEFSLDPYAWQLQGDISQRSERNYLKAIEYYSKSFDFGNSTDKNLLLKICECYLKMTEKFDEKKATEWLIKAEEIYKNNKIVIDLKEKLLSNGQNGEIKNHETFLISLLNENSLDEELHLKLIKIYLKSSNVAKAVHYLAKIEYKQIFSSTLWYTRLIDAIESTLTTIGDHNNDEYEKELLISMLTILLFRQLKTTLQTQTNDDSNCYLEIFLKLDKYISTVEKFTPCKKRIIEQIKSEQLAQYHFILGLLLNMKNIDPDVTNWTENKTKLATLACFLKSSMISKPNSFTSELETTIRSNDDELSKSIEHDLIRLVQRESALRYSIIGNWILFIVAKHFNDDQIEFFQHIYKFSADYDIKSIISEHINLDEDKLSESDSYIKRLKKEFFHFQTDKLIVFDHLTLNLADKLTMEYQTYKLRYLVWYCLINTKFVKSTHSSELSQIPPYFFFRSTKKNSKKLFNKIAFGVNNLNICNIESLSLIDLKVFLYLVYYQSLSYVINKSDESNFFLEPFYHPKVSKLCSEKQENWWFQMATKLFESSSMSRLRKTPTTTTTSIIEMPIDEPIYLNLDSKTKKELCNVLELVRLKSYSVKIDSTRYEQNLSICAHLAKYLQFLCDCLSANPKVTREENTIRSLAIEQEVIECPPKEKLDFIQKFLDRYSNFVKEQTHKMKQIENLSLNESVVDEVNYFVNYYGPIEQTKDDIEVVEIEEEEEEEMKKLGEDEEKTLLQETDFEKIPHNVEEIVEIEEAKETRPEEVKITATKEKEEKKPEVEIIEIRSEEVKATMAKEIEKQSQTEVKQKEQEEVNKSGVVDATTNQSVDEEKGKQVDEQMQQSQTVGPSKSLINMIEILKNQKNSQKIQMSMDTLKEQIEMIRVQYKQIDHEIKLLNKFSMRPKIYQV